ncbi:type IV pilus assembly protein [Pandoraea capi]|uniref:Type IV pilus assembly protein n=1 Tax=Pandoraea capi TaxID=2508286 RepID=A0ABY6VUX4_9BURK|nr:toxin co-regulated pilus biosynthesis Q family protein [Pandoraea capi]VVD91341.1 type IV pilus assembly protein [Pandoraea capi]
MTHPGMRVASVALLFVAALPLARASSAPQTDVTWMFASHKPLMHSVGVREPGDPGPVPGAAPLAAVVDLPSEALRRQGVDDARRHVQAASVPVPAPLAPTQVPPDQPSPSSAAFELALQPSDGRVSQAVRRYAERHGWQLAWEIDRDFPIEYPATFRGDFLGVVEQIVRSLQNTDAPIRVKVYEANRVLRVVHATQ